MHVAIPRAWRSIYNQANQQQNNGQEDYDGFLKMHICCRNMLVRLPNTLNLYIDNNVPIRIDRIPYGIHSTLPAYPCCSSHRFRN